MTIEEKATAFDELMKLFESLDCGSNSCLFRSSDGQRTNSSCHSLDHRVTMQLTLHKIAKKYREIKEHG